MYFQNRPAKNTVKVTMKAGPRRSLSKLKNLMKSNRYRRDLKSAALRRASAVLKSQKPVQAKKVRGAKKAE